MSYILDALKKAAEQRDAHAPAMHRLLSPSPVLTDSPRWRIAAGGGAGAVVAIALTSWLLWPSAPVVVVETPTSSAARVQPETPAVHPPAPPAPPIVRTAPPKPAPPAKTVDERPRPVEAAPARPQPTAAPPSVIATLRPVPPAVPGPAAAVAPAPKPAPIVAVTPPPTTTAPAGPRAELSAPMRLEVIVYSEERARRLAFINGRKYVEGDLVLDSARIQEIQPNSVVIIEDGRRVVLRP